VANPEVTFHGEAFTVRDVIPEMAIMRFADVAVRGVSSHDMEGRAAMYVLLKACLAEDDWPRFEQLAIAKNATHEDYWQVVQDVMVALTERPMERPSDSSDGPTVTSPKSEDDSSSRVIRKLEAQGRPDWALVVKEVQEQSQAV
jgi:hypothetical protein